MMAMLVLLLLLLQIVSITAFPSRAGSCPSSKAAVAGRHVADDGGTRSVSTGSLSDKNIQFFIDGTELNSQSVVEVDLGVEHAVEIVSSTPFKGALIRFESESEFTLLPEINAQTATSCTASAIGVCHDNNNIKNVMSAGFRSDLTASFKIDVTVVEYSNSTGSAYLYSQYTLRTVQANNEAFVPSVSPPATFLPTASSFPTFEQKCEVCGAGKVIGDPEAEVYVEGNVGSCQELSEDGLKGLIPPELCPEIQLAAEMACSCTALPTPAATMAFEPTISPWPTYEAKCQVCGEDGYVTDVTAVVTLDGEMGTCLDLERDGKAGFIGPDLCDAAKALASKQCGCATEEQSYPQPSSTTSPYPTFSQKCNVCGEGMQVMKRGAVVTVGGGTGTCRELESEGAGGYISPELCQDAKAVAETVCGCMSLSSPPSPSSSTYLPTGSPYPTYSETCQVCIQKDSVVSNSDTVVEIGGDKGTCRDLQDIARNNLLPPELCAEAQTAAVKSCGCKSTAPSPSVTSLSPTRSAWPTVTQVPSYGGDPCFICDPGNWVTEQHTTVVIDNLVVTCSELQEAGIERLLPPEFCPVAKAAAKRACGCTGVVPAPSPAKSATFTPTHTAYPTYTGMPTYRDQCMICGTRNHQITKKSTDVTVGGIVLTCKELEEAGLERDIPPYLCAQAQQRAQAACACRSTQDNQSNSSPAPSQMLTLFPTIILTVPSTSPAPTFSQKCNVCDDENLRVTNLKKEIVVSGIKLTCGLIDEYGATGYVPPELCPQAQKRALESCGCREAGNAVLPPVGRPGSAPISIGTDVATSSDSQGSSKGGLDFSSAEATTGNPMLTAMALLLVVWLV